MSETVPPYTLTQACEPNGLNSATVHLEINKGLRERAAPVCPIDKNALAEGRIHGRDAFAIDARAVERDARNRLRAIPARLS